MSQAFDLNAAAGMGTENIDRKVLGMPILQVIQKGSPQFDETHADYGTKRIDGCRPGDIILSSENRVIGRSTNIVVLGVTTIYTVWKPEAQGGGFLGNAPLDIVDHRDYRRGQKGTPNEHKEWLGSNELKYTMVFDVLFEDRPNVWTQGFINCTATQLKFARNFQRQLLTMRHPSNQDVVPPLFIAQWKLSTVAESNEKGSWFGFAVERVKFFDLAADVALLNELMASAKESPKRLPQPGPDAGQPALTAGSSAPAEGQAEGPF